MLAEVERIRSREGIALGLGGTEDLSMEAPNSRGRVWAKAQMCISTQVLEWNYLQGVYG